MKKGMGLKKALVVAGVALFVGGMLIPAHAITAASVSLNGSGDARALDLAVPGLQNLTSPTALGACPTSQVAQISSQVPCALTLGATGAIFSSKDSNFKDPTSAAGFASGKCPLIGSSADPTNQNLCPGSSSTKFSYAPSPSGTTPGEGSGTPKCETPQVGTPLSSILQISAACGASESHITSDMPVSNNSAGVATVDFTIDLNTLLSYVADQAGQGQTATQVEQIKDTVVDGLAGTLDGVFQLAKGTISSVTTTADGTVDPVIDKISQAIDSFLSRAQNGSQAVAVRTGASSTNVVEDGNKTKVIGQAAGATIGILGLTDPLTDGLLIISTTASQAEVDLDHSTSKAKASIEPVNVTVKARDLLDLNGDGNINDYVTCSLSLNSTACLGLEKTLPPISLDSLLANLDHTPLATSIKVLPDSADTVPGPKAAASVGGVKVWALQGLGATNVSPTNPVGDANGGIEATLVHADAFGSISSVGCCGAVTRGSNPVIPAGVPGAPGGPVQTNLPFTGGPTRLLFGLALILAVGAPLVLLLARRVRASA
jgi:hypothetical protein